MEPNQNFNTYPFSLSSSSSGNLPNDSKKSEKAKSKKSILRKEGSQSKNKEKHATFVEPSLNQVAFYFPDNNNLNKNNRISLNTVSEEPEPNSRSGSELINNRNMSYNRINTEQKLTFDNEINNSLGDINKNNNKSFAYFTNDNSSFFDNNNNKNNKSLPQYNQDQQEIVEPKAIIFKNQNIKKPTSRKTLDSDYALKDFNTNNDINNIQVERNIDNKIEDQSQVSKVLKIKISNSGRNSFSNDNSVNNSFEQNNNELNNNNFRVIRNQINNLNNLDDSSNEKRERREEQTKINTEVNKNLFNINAQQNSLEEINNNKIPTNNMIDNMSNQINELISKNNNSKKPNFKKRITMAMDIGDQDEFLYEQNNNNDLANNNIVIQNREKKMPRNKKRITMALNQFDDDTDEFNNNINNNLEQKNVEAQNNSKRLYKDYNNATNNNEEVIYVEPKITAQNRNINYELYEKYLKYNNLNFPKS